MSCQMKINTNEIIFTCMSCKNKINEDRYHYCIMYCSNWNPNPKCDVCLKNDYCWKNFKINKKLCSCSYCREIICDCNYCKYS